MKRVFPFMGAISLIAALCLPSCQAVSSNETDDVVYLNVYNSADYINEEADYYEENPLSGNAGLLAEFERYCQEEYGTTVIVNYSTFDTNETMLSELKTGKASYDLVCPSDYVIQKMIREDMIEPFDEGSTPNYDQYVSPFVYEKMSEIEINGEKGLVNDYARGYMWGTLGLLYNNNLTTLSTKKFSITPEEMDEDMTDWASLWDDKYHNLLSIKDSVRDTYAAGILYTYTDDFQLDGKEFEGLATLKEKHDDGTYDDDTYNKKVTEIFNMCDDITLNRVGDNLKKLKENSFGFEVDSGKTDMIVGNKFAINLAWSGDAAYSMDNLDEFIESGTIEGEEVDTTTTNYANLKYVLPETGANIWFDGWVMPKGANKVWASRFVDFFSTPEYTAENMEYIGYTPVIAGDAILDLVQSWYDERYVEEEVDDEGNVIVEGGMDYDALDKDNPEFEEEYYTKDISYFFEGTLEEKEERDCEFYLSLESQGKQFDTQYPDKDILPRLAVMADFGGQNASMLLMWESVKNTVLPTWFYIVVAAGVLVVAGFIVSYYVRKAVVKNRRKARKEARKQA
ncbi:MAG: extracellular solute-binding protein [Bacilli bacterium]|nr:extracellular solute-binding protein [Bacilli bacterium]